MNCRLCLATICLAAAGSAMGCGGVDEGIERPNEAAPSVASSDGLRALNSDLALGSRGDGVAAVQDYLHAYGYFPNEELSREYPSWRSKVAQKPATWGVFDATTEEAVRHLQRQYGLEASGIVDEPTRHAIQTPRCGHPDGLPEHDDEKFALTSKWNKTHLTWRLTNNNDVSLPAARAAVAAAFHSWAQETTLTFQEVTGGEDINLQFTSLSSRPAAVLAIATQPSDGGDIKFDTNEAWSVATPTPSNKIDLQTLALHEIGHALGLDHSSFFGTVMFPTYITAMREPFADDKVAISAQYDTWELVSGCAKDIDSGVFGRPWVIGCTPMAGGFEIFQRIDERWQAATGNLGATRIAVEGVTPWVITDAGTIYRRTSQVAGFGTWERMPLCGKDIAAGSGTDAVWLVDCSNTVSRWVGFGWEPVDSPPAHKIAVDSSGHPWIVGRFGGEVYRRTTSSSTSGSWELVSGDHAITTTDIATYKGLSFSGGYAWALGDFGVPGGFEIAVRMRQDAITNAPARDSWVWLPGGAASIAVETFQTGGGLGPRPWAVTNTGAIGRVVR